VTINIGANDLFLCEELTPDHCTGSDFQTMLAQVAQNLTTIYTAIRGSAHYHHALVLLSYYTLDYSNPTDVAVIQALNTALAGPTKQFGGIVADGFGAFQRASKNFGGDVCAAGLLVALPGGGCNIHPSHLGHLLLAAAIARSLDRDHAVTG
jgi:lysophospholipase L1-like esterase